MVVLALQGPTPEYQQMNEEEYVAEGSEEAPQRAQKHAELGSFEEILRGYHIRLQVSKPLAWALH